jgi:hypothetical protein
VNGSGKENLHMNSEPLHNYEPMRPLVMKEDKIDPMWAADEDDRRVAIIRRAAAGARKALRQKD